MSILFLCISLLVFVVPAQGEPHNCSHKYTPSNYTGFLRVPADCSVITPSYCPRSWKTGIPEGRATSKPLVYSEFIICHEGFASCGYVPINPKTGLVLGRSGVTIGAGVDLGSKSKNTSVFSSLPSSLVDKLEPYFGLRQNHSACAVLERPLNLSSSEARNLTDVVKENVAGDVAKRYGEDKETKSPEFASLPRGIRTAIVSVWFQFGYPKEYPRFWNFVTKNYWKEAATELRNFYKNADEQQKGDLRRRNNEADIIEATFVECDRSLDAVILLDESGSVSPQSFAQSLNFVKNLITAFPDEKLRGDDSTRFGLSTFSYSGGYDPAIPNVVPHFYLSSHTSQFQYKVAIDNIRQRRGGTYLGFALDKVLTDQFTKRRGLRSEEDGIPRVLIVLTDGISQDSVKIPAQRVRDKNIVIYAIGIGDYDPPQLEEVASSPSHVYTLSTFFQLETFIATLTAATCNEAQPISLYTKVKATARKNDYQYFLFNVDKNSKLKITINDLSGETLIYASRSNPHPYKYDNDLSFDFALQKNKVLVISPEAPTIEKRATEHEDKKSIYISITAKTASSLFTIQGKTCDTCSEGTNEVELIPLSKIVNSTVEENEYGYFYFNVDVQMNSNLKITVNDIYGETLVYASRSNTQPDKHDNDVKFYSSFQKNKVLFMSPKAPSINKRATSNKDMKSIYISVTAYTENAMFTIQGNTCNPSVNCTEGTNELFFLSRSSSIYCPFFALMAVTMGIVVFYLSF